MHFGFKRFFFGVIPLIALVLITSCQPDSPTDPNLPTTNLKEAQLKDFQFFEVSYLDIKITHPEVVNDEEVKQGKVEITIPYTQKSLMLSLKQFDLDGDKYSIAPSVGEQRDFSNGPVTYAISLNFNEDKAVHYLVNVVYGGEPLNENVKITGFRFEKIKNSGLEATIEAVKVVEYLNYSENAIYVIVPVGTDFGNLVPTITYDAAKLYYSSNNEFKPYPEKGLSIDFKYPKHFYLQAENSFGVKSNVYNVIVDVENPIKFEQPLIVTPNVKTGNGMTSEYFAAHTKWTNQGNHPITGMTPIGYKDKIYPVIGYPGDANIITASLSNPIGGIPGVLPGERGDVNVKVSRTAVAGTFKTTVMFTPTFSFNTRIISYWPVGDQVEGVFKQQSVTIESTLED